MGVCDHCVIASSLGELTAATIRFGPIVGVAVTVGEALAVGDE